ncbi:hypothetical protein KBX59_13110, partial [Lentilactobacillus hilgardii]|nr:hypothetical protein [Lentilactobacillus hilgardii]MCP9350842.1 hypothetical protein [Lentilactobacillus hilgardii]MCP9353746.1 hypothetical protein [Lentilactobacillus hilgardii]
MNNFSPDYWLGISLVYFISKAVIEVNPHSWMKNSNYGGFTMTKFSFEVKLKAVQMYLAGIGSPT